VLRALLGFTSDKALPFHRKQTAGSKCVLSSDVPLYATEKNQFNTAREFKKGIEFS